MHLEDSYTSTDSNLLQTSDMFTPAGSNSHENVKPDKLMGFQSFGSKVSGKKEDSSINKVKAYKPEVVDKILQSNIQEFLNEAKSIEDEIHKYASRYQSKERSTRRKLQNGFNTFSRNRVPKYCRSVDHSIDKEALAGHLNLGVHNDEVNSNCKL
jgi:hypothetical protein